MKRVYTDSYLTRNPKAVIGRSRSFLIRERRKVFAGFVLALVLLFAMSCLLVVSDTRTGVSVSVASKSFAPPAGPRPTPPWVGAVSAVLIDSESGRILYEKNAHANLPVASTTKMMTALVVRKHLKLKEKVVISPEAAAVGEEEIWLEPGETQTVEDLLWAMLVQSANDAAYALAQQTSGSIAGFADLMNQEARKIGAVESHFTNPHGLDAAGHYSTAYDLALIARELMKDPVLAKMVSSGSHNIPWPGHPYLRTALGHNDLLGKYPGANGVKTGYTIPAGYCLVGSAARDGKELVAVALNSEHRVSDVSSLLDYGFNGTERVIMVRKGENLGVARVSSYPRKFVRIVAGEDLAVLSLKGSADKMVRKVVLPKKTAGSVKKGTGLGDVQCQLDGRTIYRDPARTAAGVYKPGYFAGGLAFIWYSICRTGKIISAPFRIF